MTFPSREGPTLPLKGTQSILNEAKMAKKVFRSLVLSLALTTMATAALAVGPQYTLHVKGLSCPFCAYGIEKKLSRIKGVEKVETDIARGTVTVTMADGAKLDKDTAARAVKEAGFSLGGFEEVQAGSR